MASIVMERHLIAYAILLLVLIGALLLWRRSRRVRRAPEPHMRIDLIAGDGEDPKP
jgi:ABC-type nickel/cobalt efflux system permease component RcnA